MFSYNEDVSDPFSSGFYEQYPKNTYEKEDYSTENDEKYPQQCQKFHKDIEDETADSFEMIK